jgi:hypothetical protein
LNEQKNYKGGEKASRNNPEYCNKQKEIRLDKNLSFSRKHSSSETAYTSLGILGNPKNLLKIGTSEDI